MKLWDLPLGRARRGHFSVAKFSFRVFFAASLNGHCTTSIVQNRAFYAYLVNSQFYPSPVQLCLLFSLLPPALNCQL